MLDAGDLVGAESMSMPDAINILVADDVDEMRELVICALRELEKTQSRTFTIAEAKDGVDTMNRIRQEFFHVLLLDIKMPELDGFGVVEAIKTLPDDRKPLRVFVITNYAAHFSNIEDLMNRGVAGILEQPINLKTIAQVIEGL
jgi:CheY-like chemotaxis protein